MLKLKMLLAGAVLSSTVLITACSESVKPADLDRVLDVTSDTLYQFEQSPNAQDKGAVELFAKKLESNMRTASPQVHPGPLGVEAKKDGSFAGYHDKNNNMTRDSGEKDLFTVEIDSEKQRLIATDVSGNVRDHSFSGTGLIAGLLIGQLLGRQRAAGVNPKSLSNKRAMSASQYKSARSKSTSGSHTRGK